jgi:hypothetical protein
MSTQEPEKLPRGQEERRRNQACAEIGKQVLRTLGEPDNLRQVQVHHLWEDHFRVNILVGVEAASAKVAHSYFLEADLNGQIREATPRITKRY